MKPHNLKIYKSGIRSIGLAVIVLTLFVPSQFVLAQQALTLDCKELTESSGVAASLNDPKLAWTHNDSGGRPRLYLFTVATGKIRATFEVKDALNIDWEDICCFQINGKNYLAIGDIGDNSRRRDHIEISILEEPIAPAQDRATGEETGQLLETLVTLQVTYPDKACDCEALAFDPAQSRFILVTKDYLSAKVMSVPLDKALLNKSGSRSDVKAEQIQTIAIALVTGADIYPDTRQLVICNYGAAYLLGIQSDDSSKWDTNSMRKVTSPKRPQGEAIAFAAADQLLYTSEGSPTKFWLIDLKTDSK